LCLTGDNFILNVDFKKDRPFIERSNDELKLFAIDCFADEKLDLEIATLIYEELKLRKSLGSRKLLSEIKLNFSSVNHQPIKWLSKARLNIKKINKIDNKSKNLNSIYVILRNGYSKENLIYGAYVGQTSKAPEKRFIEHKSGIRSARGLKKYGLQVLRSLWPYGGVNSSKKLCYETKLHLNLKEVIPKVSGDVNCDELDKY
jgi:hypothetical protein